MAYLQYFIYVRAALVWEERNLPSVGVCLCLPVDGRTYASCSTLVQVQRR
jgi:hypothetical protein